MEVKLGYWLTRSYAIVLEREIIESSNCITGSKNYKKKEGIQLFNIFRILLVFVIVGMLILGSYEIFVQAFKGKFINRDKK